MDFSAEKRKLRPSASPTPHSTPKTSLLEPTDSKDGTTTHTYRHRQRETHTHASHSAVSLTPFAARLVLNHDKTCECLVSLFNHGLTIRSSPSNPPLLLPSPSACALRPPWREAPALLPCPPHRPSPPPHQAPTTHKYVPPPYPPLPPPTLTLHVSHSPSPPPSPPLLSRYSLLPRSCRHA